MNKVDNSIPSVHKKMNNFRSRRELSKFLPAGELPFGSHFTKTGSRRMDYSHLPPIQTIQNSRLLSPDTIIARIESEHSICPNDYFERIQMRRKKLVTSPLVSNTNEMIPPDQRELLQNSNASIETEQLPTISPGPEVRFSRIKTPNNPTKVRFNLENMSNVENEQGQTLFGSVRNSDEQSSVPEYKVSDHTRSSHRSKQATDSDGNPQRDRYLSVMEDMINKHKTLSIRSARSPLAFGTPSSVVPGRRIQAISSYPEDPMMRFTGRHIHHSSGFRFPDKSESLIVEPDEELLRQVAMLHECEKELLPTTASVAQQRFTIHGGKSLKERRQSSQLELTESLEEAHSVCSDLESLDSGESTPLGLDQDQWIDEKRVYFHFDPVVQIYPNQGPWRSRSRLHSRIEFDDVATVAGPAGSIGGGDGTDGAGVDLGFGTVTGDTMRRPNSAGPDIGRTYSVNETAQIKTLFKYIVRHNTSASSMSDDSHMSSNMNTDSEILPRHSEIRRAHSLSDLPLQTPTNGVNLFLLASDAEEAQIDTDDSNSPKSINMKKGSFSIRDVHLGTLGGKQSMFGMHSSISHPADHGKSVLEAQQCLDLIAASADPNPMSWFDLLDNRLETARFRSTFREKLTAQFRLKGLARRFIAIPNGMLGLQRELEKGWEIRPKAELMMKCVVKHHVLKMPMAVQNGDLVEKFYLNSIVRHPILYKLLMRRREILPQELQHFLNRIMEMTETSDRSMATITNSTTKLAAVTTAAREMDASGLMTGGPKVKTVVKDKKSMAVSTRPSQAQRKRASELTTLVKPEVVARKSETEQEQSSKKESGYCSLYGKETDFDKGFYTTLRNPCTNILEEVAQNVPEFAWHIRPLFEHKWACLEDDVYDRLKTKLMASETQKYNSNVTVAPFLISPTALMPCREDMLQMPETLEYCTQLFRRVRLYFTVMHSPKPGDGILYDLLICLHMSTYFSKLAAQIVNELDGWIPYLLSSLENSYSSVREEACCVLSYLACAYRLVTKLHVTSKNLLVANITLSILSAIGRYPETYPFYHAVLGYMLHALPCLSLLDCLLLWLPTVEADENNLVARDWALFIYYVIRHWPRNPFYLDTLYQKKLIKPLETSFLTKFAKRPARLALSYLVRTCNVRSALLTCWPDNDHSQN